MTREEIQSSFVKRFFAPRQNGANPVTSEALCRVEKELKISFPTAYFNFLTQHGPVFTPSILDLVTGGDTEQPPAGASFDVQEFFNSTEIVKTHQLYTSGGMEAWLVPIASDSMGNVFGFKREEISPRPNDSPVWIFDHDFCEIHLVAESFDGWLASFLRLSK